MPNVAEPPWVVIDTPCRPRRYKVVRKGQHDAYGGSSNNSWTEYFVHPFDAQTEADKRNEKGLAHIANHRSPLEKLADKVLIECLRECMRSDMANYEDLLLRWCAARRAYPTFDMPEPPMPPGLDLSELRTRTIAEFNRSL